MSKGFRKRINVGWKFTPHNLIAFAPKAGIKVVTIFNKPNIPVPTFGDHIPYTGNEITATFENFNPSKVIISGNIATNVGTYTAVAVPVDGYEWEDYDTAPREIQWSIIPIDPIITFERATLEYTSILSEYLPVFQVKGIKGEDITGTFSWITTDAEFINMTDIATVQWKFVPDSHNYNTITGILEIDIDYLDIENLPVMNNGVFTYDGTTKTPTWSNYDPSLMDMIGDISAIDAGVYEIKVTPKDNYEWSDGTKTPQIVRWSIEHAKIAKPYADITTFESTGSAQSLVLVNYNEDTIDISGNISEISAGVYYTTLTPKTNYLWDDGTSDPITIEWSINRIDLTVTANNRSIVGYTSDTIVLNINSEVTDPTTGIDYTVVAIDVSAFNGCTSLTEVSLPDTCLSIGKTAFAGCSGITKFNIGNGVTDIGQQALYNCTSLTSIDIPSNVKSLGTGVFYKCAALAEIVLHEGLTTINSSAFRETAIYEITIPSTVATLSYAVFNKCTNLTSIVIPATVQSFSTQGQFQYCVALEEITILAPYTNIEASAFSNSGIKSFIIPDGVETIGANAFYTCNSLTSITIPDTVKSIDQAAFYQCTSLQEINLPDSITVVDGSIGHFRGSGLISIIIPSSIGDIPEQFCNLCANLQEVKISSGIQSIAAYGFGNISSLNTIYIPNTVTNIEDDAFKNSTVDTVIFDGTEEEWNAISIGDNNEALTNATKVFNTTA